MADVDHVANEGNPIIDPAVGADGEHDHPFPADPYSIDCTASVFIAGIMHVVSNATKDLDTALNHYATFLKQLTAICHMLSKTQQEAFARNVLPSLSPQIVCPRLCWVPRPCASGSMGECVAWCSVLAAIEGILACCLVKAG
eukprot:15459594-Alexandrium_andersonii.AAC.1